MLIIFNKQKNLLASSEWRFLGVFYSNKLLLFHSSNTLFKQFFTGTLQGRILGANPSSPLALVEPKCQNIWYLRTEATSSYLCCHMIYAIELLTSCSPSSESAGEQKGYINGANPFDPVITPFGGASVSESVLPRLYKADYYTLQSLLQEKATSQIAHMWRTSGSAGMATAASSLISAKVGAVQELGGI